MQLIDFASEAEASRFYDEHYRRGYMDDWPAEKKRRVADLLGEVAKELPPRGRALDFGTGNGVFAGLLRHALPGWEVYGSDLSPVSLEQARARFPGCTFLSPDALRQSGLRFDFIFSHHVLEHVLDVRETWADLNRLAAPRAAMLHILPCGNEGSLEHRLCRIHENGIDPARGNRFFFEEEAHLRRLTSAELAGLAAAHGFALNRAYFANQFWGAVEWITAGPPEILRQLTGRAGLAPAVPPGRLLPARAAMTSLSLLRRVWSGYRRTLRTRPKRPRQLAVLALAWPMLPPAYVADALLRRGARREWERHRRDPNGSEMYLVFSRPGAAASTAPAYAAANETGEAGGADEADEATGTRGG